MAERWDCADYNFLDFNPSLGTLLFMESKLSQRDPARIYLSENERQPVIEYFSDEFAVAYPSAAWRLYLVTES